jgi:hypothetical protein
MPEDQPRFVGWYSHHRIRIYEDPGDEKPWRVVFDPTHAVDAEGKGYRLDYPEARERTADAAQVTAKGLAQNVHLGNLPYQENIEWRDLSADPLTDRPTR